MNKKLIAVAVAGALGAPALALAQASTVQIYGTLVMNYNRANSGGGIPTVDAWNSHDGGLGFKGEESVGGGLKAWFQCESTLDPTGGSTSSQTVNTSGSKAAISTATGGWCGRNSGFGMKGDFGNIYAGIWDTPMKIVMGNFRPFSTAGAYGMGLMWNESASNVSNPTQVGQVVNKMATAAAVGGGTAAEISPTASQQAGTVALGGTAAGTSFSRRQNNTLSYWTPEIGGISGGFQFSDSKEGLLQNHGTVPSKPRMWDVGVMYKNGPMIIGGGYQKHQDYNPAGMLPGGSAATVASGIAGASNTVANAASVTYTGGNDRAWNVGVAYTFAVGAGLKMSAIYTDAEYNMNTSTGGVAGAATLSRTAWGVFGDWAIMGPHRVRGEYVRGNSTSGTYTGAIGNWVGNAGAGQTGSTIQALQYAYHFSKRTELNFGYSRLQNDSSAQDKLQSLSTTNTGQSQSAWVLGTKHTF